MKQLSYRPHTTLSFRAKSRNLILLAVIAGVTGNLLPSCEKANVAELQMGQIPDEEVLTGLPAISFRAVSFTSEVVHLLLPEGGNFTSVKLQARASRPLELSQSLLVQPDESLVEAFNAQYKAQCTLLPAPFYTLENGGVIDIPSGKKESDEKLLRIYATNPLGNVLEAGTYVLPLKASNGETIYIALDIQAPFSGRPELYTGDDCFTVFYLNTSQYDPRLVLDYVTTKMDPIYGWTNAIGNIVNFTSLRLDYDASSQAPVLKLSPDMRYLLDNYDKYFRPVKETGRKLCLCIETGSKKLGFCNMNDQKIDSFVAQAMQVVNQYGFDGINLWDKNCSYGEEGAPINTESYPKLIKELRKALGNYKLLTLTDYEEPTEYFWDVEATGGIVVGELLDYAWSGYYNTNEPVQVIDPWHPNNPGVSQLHVRKPIAGLSSARYGCVMAARRNPMDYDVLSEWSSGGYVLNNISVTYDIETYLQGKYEGTITANELLRYLCPGSFFMFNPWYLSGRTSSGYNAWMKDW